MDWLKFPKPAKNRERSSSLVCDENDIKSPNPSLLDSFAICCPHDVKKQTKQFTKKLTILTSNLILTLSRSSPANCWPLGYNTSIFVSLYPPHVWWIERGRRTGSGFPFGWLFLIWNELVHFSKYGQILSIQTKNKQVGLIWLISWLAS